MLLGPILWGSRAESVAQGIQLLDDGYQTLKTCLLNTITFNWRKPDIAKSRDIDFIAGLKSHITSTVEQKRNY